MTFRIISHLKVQECPEVHLFIIKDKTTLYVNINDFVLISILCYFNYNMSFYQF